MVDALETSIGSLKFAPIGKRLMAFVLDLFVLGLVMLMMQFTIPYVAPFLVWVAYKTLFEASAVQATPGKRAMDLIVVGPRGQRITIGTSLLRTFVAWISVFTGFLIYAVAFFTPRRQAVHDMVAETFVVEGRMSADPGKAWTKETKKVYEGARGVFKNGKWDSEKDRLDLLEKLASLHKKGVLSDTEFEKRKRAILNEDD